MTDTPTGPPRRRMTEDITVRGFASKTGPRRSGATGWGERGAWAVDIGSAFPVRRRRRRVEARFEI